MLPFNALNLVRGHVLRSRAELLFGLMILDICSAFHLFSFHFSLFFLEDKSKMQFAEYFNKKDFLLLFVILFTPLFLVTEANGNHVYQDAIFSCVKINILT